MELEQAIQLLSDRPARLYGIKERGRISEGWFADVVIFDEERIAPGPIYFRRTCPRGLPASTPTQKASNTSSSTAARSCARTNRPAIFPALYSVRVATSRTVTAR